MTGLREMFTKRRPAGGGDTGTALETEEVRAPDTTGTLSDIDNVLAASERAEREQKTEKKRCCGCFC